MKTHRRIRGVRAVAWALLLATAPWAARAATITVSTLADVDVGNDGQCSLREAIEAANTDLAHHECGAGSGSDRIDFSVDGTLLLNADLQEISGPTTIEGPGRDLLVVDGGLQHTVFRIDAPGGELLQIRDLTITRALGGFGAAVSSAIDDSVTLSGVLISDCEATFGGALYSDDSGEIRILHSEIRGNRGNLGGGGLYVSSSASLFVQDSTLAENFAGPDDGTTDANGGGLNIVGTPFDLRRSTVSGNGARGHGGGLYLLGSDGTIRNSTIVGNFADPDNDGHSGGGLRIDGTALNEVRFGGSIVAENTDGSVNIDHHPDLSLHGGAVVSLSYNWIGVNASVETAFPAPTVPGEPNLNADFVGTDVAPIDPGLGVLTDNGGPTRTHRPLAASGVVDQGNCPVASQDQRAYRNPETGRRVVDIAAVPDLADGCDIGAVERGASPVVDDLPFLDGFESGDTSAWSSTVN